MTIHIDYDREENNIGLIFASQGNVISALVNKEFLFQTEVKDWVCWQNSSHNFLHKTTLTFEMFFL